MLKLCLALRDKYSIAAVTNDIFTRQVRPPIPLHISPPLSVFSHLHPPRPLPPFFFYKKIDQASSTPPEKTPNFSRATPLSPRNASWPSRREAARTPPFEKIYQRTCTLYKRYTHLLLPICFSSRAAETISLRITAANWRISSSMLLMLRGEIRCRGKADRESRAGICWLLIRWVGGCVSGKFWICVISETEI